MTATTTTQLAPGVAHLAITGELTAAGEQDLMAAHQQATDDAAHLIVLDFSGLEYMNSGGIGMLVTLLVRSQRRQQRLVAVGLSDHYRQIFELTRLDEAIGLYPNLDAVLASLA